MAPGWSVGLWQLAPVSLHDGVAPGAELAEVGSGIPGNRPLEFQGLSQGRFGTLRIHALDGPDDEGIDLANGPGYLKRPIDEFLVGHDLGHQAEPLRPAGIDQVAGHGQKFRLPKADGPG
jgi:hypothetical protein